ncbi:hypothetical protein PVAND_008650 [Polypedilum vanderplanki]|uniref:Anaphase-promoting complex subunit 2 n=1 Tax=Polypedilum vanderplanki TaxID=319348 RepID=A0A9J6CAW7_POLVA|nr:hypothetical protein PVAND_008650 [Polypedilum vanderplanki]
MEGSWNKLKFCFPIISHKLEYNETNREKLDELCKELISLNVLDEITQMLCLEIQNTLLKQIVPEFWKPFFENNLESQSNNKAKQKCEFQIFRNAITQLFRRYQLLNRIMVQVKYLESKTGKKLIYNFDEVFKSSLLSQLPDSFTNIVHAFYYVSFKVFINTKADNDDDEEFMEEREECLGCEMLQLKCQCQELVNAFGEINLCLTKMGLLDRISGYTLTHLIQNEIYNHIQKTCKGNFDTQHLKNLEKWLDTIVLEWLTRIYNNGSSKLDPTNTKIRESINCFQMKLKYFLYEKYANSIIDQFFNIIIEFPESQPAIDDLKLCMEKLDLRAHLVETLKTSLKTRLLHQGVDTCDIITGYVATIKTMRHLEKSGILLQTCTEPVKEYLRKCRQDTVRCVVTSLIEETPSDLAEELARSEAIKAEENERNKDEMNNWQEWSPDPVDAITDSEKHSRNRKSDIISMIVDIYGSKELFVNEYRNLLAERLLINLDFNPEKEIRNLELLKLRFGENLLHSCEVMLRDISDSKRINAHILESETFTSTAEKDEPSVSALIVSSQFWPTFKKETMELPDEMNKIFERYKKSYEEYKGNRTLCWSALNGKVNIEIEINDKKLDLTVTPAQATIIWHFQNQKEWQLDSLSTVINMPPSVLRRRIGFWQLQGLIRETKENLFVLCDEKQQDCEMETQVNVVLDEEETMVSANDQREEELQVFWSYILGMLTNLDSMPLERIHQMLKLFASQGPGFEFSQDELKSFLQRKVREHKLVYALGVYQLPKN